MKRSFLLIIISILISITKISVSSAKNLLLIQQILYHGLRLPSHVHQKDYLDLVLKWRSTGQLTSQGKHQLYILGQQIYKKYWKLLFQNTPFDKVYNQSKVYVRSTNYNRTIQSAMSHMMGIYQNLEPLKLSYDQLNNSLPQWPNLDEYGYINSSQNQFFVYGNSKNYHPISIHIQSDFIDEFHERDMLLHSGPSWCPTLIEQSDQNRNSQLALNLFNFPKIQEF